MKPIKITHKNFKRELCNGVLYDQGNGCYTCDTCTKDFVVVDGEIQECD